MQTDDGASRAKAGAPANGLCKPANAAANAADGTYKILEKLHARLASNMVILWNLSVRGLGSSNLPAGSARTLQVAGNHCRGLTSIFPTQVVEQAGLGLIRPGRFLHKRPDGSSGWQ